MTMKGSGSKGWTPHAVRTAGATIAMLASAACSNATQPGSCDVTLPGGNCLQFEDDDALASRHADIEAAVVDALARSNAVLPIQGVTLRVRDNAAGAIPGLGFGGFNPSAQEVILSFDPNAAVLDRSIREDLGPTVAHELHHALRRRTVGYGSTLLQAMVTEGLADHFAIEVLASGPPIWSKALDRETTSVMRSRAEEEWNRSPYDHARWFYGTEPSIPRWTGYTVGFDLVEAYLADDPTRRASDLVDEPAENFATRP
jgi:hypothetical protein